MHKVGVLGDINSIEVFSALGMLLFPATTEEEVKFALKKMISEEFTIIYITESAFTKAENEIDKLRNDLTPAIIPIPDIAGSRGIGLQNVKKSVERAVGSDILFNND